MKIHLNQDFPLWLRELGLHSFRDLKVAIQKEHAPLFLDLVDRCFHYSRSLYLSNKPNLALFAVILFLSVAFYISRTSHPPGLPSALGALQQVIIPTSSRWPSYYIEEMRDALLRSRSSSNANEILLELDLSRLLRDVTEGHIELRQPEDNLSLLLSEHGAAINMPGNVVLRVVVVPGLVASAKAWWADLAARVSPMSFDAAQAELVQMPNHFLLDLDTVPAAHVPQLLALLPRNTHVMLLLSSASAHSTTPDSQSPSLSSLDSRFALYAHPYVAPRTPSALHTQLSDLLSIITSSNTGLTVERVENAGAVYADALAHVTDSLENESSTRSEFIATHIRASEDDTEDVDEEADEPAMRAWRAEVLRGQWEAALVRSGMVRKWAISVRT